mmetsp:Transcript_3663/g.8714  ORF Transcript_3663/g.8714 Transcript_3663/m.8714 type:complete len:137 (-) Transcript_3663:1091-1501(-)
MARSSGSQDLKDARTWEDPKHPCLTCAFMAISFCCTILGVLGPEVLEASPNAAATSLRSIALCALCAAFGASCAQVCILFSNLSLIPFTKGMLMNTCEACFKRAKRCLQTQAARQMGILGFFAFWACQGLGPKHFA